MASKKASEIRWDFRKDEQEEIIFSEDDAICNIRKSMQFEAPVFLYDRNKDGDFSRFLSDEGKVKILMDCGIAIIRERTPSVIRNYSCIDTLKNIPLNISELRHQVVRKGVYSTSLHNVRHNKRIVDSIDFDQYQHLCSSAYFRQCVMPEQGNVIDLERSFWEIMQRNSTNQKVYYSTDNDLSLFNVRSCWLDLDEIRNLVKFIPRNVDGVKTSYVYVGYPGSFFSAHIEDLKLFSINYQHHGAGKFWYGIPTLQAEKYEKLCNTVYPISTTLGCDRFPQHKGTLIHPDVLRSNGIDVYWCLQQENDVVVTATGAYHFGFNIGMNVNEARNYGLDPWIELAKTCSSQPCACDPERIPVWYPMDEFEKYRKINEEYIKFGKNGPGTEERRMQMERTNGAQVGRTNGAQVSQVGEASTSKRGKRGRNFTHSEDETILDCVISTSKTETTNKRMRVFKRNYEGGKMFEQIRNEHFGEGRTFGERPTTSIRNAFETRLIQRVQEQFVDGYSTGYVKLGDGQTD